MVFPSSVAVKGLNVFERVHLPVPRVSRFNRLECRRCSDDIKMSSCGQADDESIAGGGEDQTQSHFPSRAEPCRRFRSGDVVEIEQVIEAVRNLGSLENGAVGKSQNCLAPIQKRRDEFVLR